MLYILNKRNDLCQVFNSSVCDVILCRDKQLIKLCNFGEKLGNCEVNNGRVRFKKAWSRGMLESMRRPGCSYIIFRCDGLTYKLVSNGGDIFTVFHEEVRRLVEDNRIINACEVYNNNSLAVSINVFDCDDTEDLVYEDIRIKYDEFILKCMTLGMNQEFSWHICGRYVIYDKYMGSCDTVIMPNFITHLKAGSLSTEENIVQKVKMNQGLKYISSFAGYDCGIEALSIPSSVRYIGIHAFNDKVKLKLNGDTVVLQECKI